MEHPRDHPWRNDDWNSMRVLLVVARAASFCKAAHERAVAINAVRRTRGADGVHLMADGRRVVSAAHDLESAIFDMWLVAALAENVVKGAGSGLTPNRASAIGGDVVYVDFGAMFKTKSGLASRPEIIKSKRHRQFIDFLADSVEPARYPWFGEQLKSPAQIEAPFSRDDLRAYFEGLTARR
jgi:hypothetical protein